MAVEFIGASLVAALDRAQALGSENIAGHPRQRVLTRVVRIVGGWAARRRPGLGSKSHTLVIGAGEPWASKSGRAPRGGRPAGHVVCIF